MKKTEVTPFKNSSIYHSLNHSTRIIVCILLSILISATASAQTSGTGVITGIIVDAETGEPLIGANAYIMNTNLGAASDLQGNYRITGVPPGLYTLRISYMGYKTQDVTEVGVEPGKVTTLNISMQSKVIEGETVVVTAKAMKNTEASLLKDRQRAKAVSDAISAEAITQSGSGNAAEAMKQITGASVVDGKYIFVRGLGDRYTSTQLNGAEIPSTDPYKRAGAIDLVPTSLVDNIVTVKSFTPDKPGNFSGGTIDIHTKDFPEILHMSFSASTSYNTQTTFNDNTLGIADAGNLQWLGIEDGSLDVPDFVGDELTEFDIIAENV